MPNVITSSETAKALNKCREHQGNAVYQPRFILQLRTQWHSGNIFGRRSSLNPHCSHAENNDRWPRPHQPLPQLSKKNINQWLHQKAGHLYTPTRTISRMTKTESMEWLKCQHHKFISNKSIKNRIVSRNNWQHSANMKNKISDYHIIQIRIQHTK